jgi:hypothetical protein
MILDNILRLKFNKNNNNYKDHPNKLNYKRMMIYHLMRIA